MYRKDSESMRADGRSGFTLVELMVALSASGVLLVGLARLFKDFNHTFNIQEQVADRDLNGHYTIKRLSEALMAAGSDLPAKGWPLITLPDGNPGSRILVSVNPRGGLQYLAAPLTGALEIPVDDPKAFAVATAVLCDPLDTLIQTKKVDINTAWNSNGFSKGIKTTATGGLVRIKSAVTLAAGDAIYGYDVEEYRLANGNLTLNSTVLAENIQSLTFTTFASNQTAASDWADMRSARLNVTARTRNRDPGYSENGGYRSFSLSMDVLLRNRL